MRDVPEKEIAAIVEEIDGTIAPLGQCGKEAVYNLIMSAIGRIVAKKDKEIARLKTDLDVCGYATRTNALITERARLLDQAAERIRAEKVDAEATGDAGDIAYNQAIDDAIRALYDRAAAESGKGEK